MGEYCLYLRKSRLDLEAEAMERATRWPSSGRPSEACPIPETFRSRAAMRGSMQRRIHCRPAGDAAAPERRGSGPLVRRPGHGGGAPGPRHRSGGHGGRYLFKYSGTRIITPARTMIRRTSLTRNTSNFGLFMSRREYKTINRRLQRGAAPPWRREVHRGQGRLRL